MEWIIFLISILSSASFGALFTWWLCKGPNDAGWRIEPIQWVGKLRKDGELLSTCYLIEPIELGGYTYDCAVMMSREDGRRHIELMPLERMGEQDTDAPHVRLRERIVDAIA